jgi:hypothetical protein
MNADVRVNRIGVPSLHKPPHHSIIPSGSPTLGSRVKLKQIIANDAFT